MNQEGRHYNYRVLVSTRRMQRYILMYFRLIIYKKKKKNINHPETDERGRRTRH